MVIISKLQQSRTTVKTAQRALVLSAARKVLLRDGPYRFSLRAVARELRCSPGAIYNYYADKDELIAASTAEAFTKLGARLRKIKKTASIGDKVRKMGELYVQFGFANPEDYALPLLAYLRIFPESGALFLKAEKLVQYFARHSCRVSFVKTAPPPLDELRP